MTTEPAVSPLFLAHGSPTLAITDIPAHRFLRGLATSLEDPKAIVVLSAHWETDGLKISAPGPLRTIHDFRGFPKELYNISYPAEASQELVSRITQSLSAKGISVTEDASWGLDHGTWVPLSLL